MNVGRIPPLYLQNPPEKPSVSHYKSETSSLFKAGSAHNSMFNQAEQEDVHSHQRPSIQSPVRVSIWIISQSINLFMILYTCSNSLRPIGSRFAVFSIPVFLSFPCFLPLQGLLSCPSRSFFLLDLPSGLLHNRQGFGLV